MEPQKYPRRRNIIWPETVDSLAAKLAMDKGMNVSELLENLVLDEAKADRIKTGKQTPLQELIADIVSAQLHKAGTGAKKIASKLKTASENKKGT